MYLTPCIPSVGRTRACLSRVWRWSGIWSGFFTILKDIISLVEKKHALSLKTEMSWKCGASLFLLYFGLRFVLSCLALLACRYSLRLKCHHNRLGFNFVFKPHYESSKGWLPIKNISHPVWISIKKKTLAHFLLWTGALVRASLLNGKCLLRPLVPRIPSLRPSPFPLLFSVWSLKHELRGHDIHFGERKKSSNTTDQEDPSSPLLFLPED